jgi:2-keto-4-pentenoate hydratase/2-oxohepta-3-ene-1,7-dioic acid hydratase in catechol pathway
MRFVTYTESGRSEARVGLVTADRVADVSSLGYPTMLDLLEGGPAALDKVRAAKLETVAMASVKLLAPIPRPRKLICVGLNYRDHAEETGSEIPAVATIFNKFATSVIGPGEAIVLPKVSSKPDYEAEFAFVIGKGGRHIQEAAWEDHVFGYTIVNDVSARDYQRATTQWLMGKTFDTFAPMGPWIVTKDEISDPHDVDVRMVINGEILQNGNTRNLIFKIPYLISFLSSVFTLEPGDVVSTGTPAGVGAARTPPRWLLPGDDVVVEIPAVGKLRNPVVAESA